MDREAIANKFKKLDPAGQVHFFNRLREHMSVRAIVDCFAKAPLDSQVSFFNRLREQSYRLAENIISESSLIASSEPLRLTGIDETACNAWTLQWKPLLAGDPHYKDRYFIKDWIETSVVHYRNDPNGRRVIHEYPHRYWAAHFEAAIWQGDILCGLSRGGEDGVFKRDIVLMEVTEGRPFLNHPLAGKIFDISLVVATAYAKILGVKDVVRVGPFSKGTLRQAARRGLIRKEAINWRGYRSSSAEIEIPIDRVLKDNRYILGPAAPALA